MKAVRSLKRSEAKRKGGKHTGFARHKRVSLTDDEAEGPERKEREPAFGIYRQSLRVLCLRKKTGLWDLLIR